MIFIQQIILTSQPEPKHQPQLEREILKLEKKFDRERHICWVLEETFEFDLLIRQLLLRMRSAFFAISCLTTVLKASEAPEASEEKEKHDHSDLLGHFSKEEISDEMKESLTYCSGVQVKYCLSCENVPSCLKSLPCALPGSKEEEMMRLELLGATLVEEALQEERPYQPHMRIVEEESQKVFDFFRQKMPYFAPFLNENKQEIKQQLENCDQTCLDKCPLQYQTLSDKFSCFETCNCLTEENVEQINELFIQRLDLNQMPDVQETSSLSVNLLKFSGFLAVIYLFYHLQRFFRQSCKQIMKGRERRMSQKRVVKENLLFLEEMEAQAVRI